MRIIDINTAIGIPTKSVRFTQIDGLLACMQDYCLDAAVVWNSVSDRDPELGNLEMYRIALEHRKVIYPCMLLEPSLETLGLPGDGSVTERLEQYRPAAVRVIQGEATHFPMNRYYAQELLLPLNEAHMPLIVDGSYSHLFWNCLPELAEAFSDVPFILLRCGLNESRIIRPLLKYTRNIYFDISVMQDFAQIEEITENFGSERLLFGSGLPQYVPAGPLGLLKYADISEADRANIAYANFERLMGGVKL